MKKIIFTFLCVFALIINVSAKDYSEPLRDLVNDGSITIESVKPVTRVDLELIIDSYIQEKLFQAGEEYYYYPESFCGNSDLNSIKNEDGSYNCSINDPYKNSSTNLHNIYDMKVYIEDESIDTDVKNKVDSIIYQINNKTYFLDDFGLLNLIINRKKLDGFTWQMYTERGIKYSNDLIKEIDNENFDFRISNKAGDGDPYWIYTAGPLSIMYKGIVYGYTPDLVKMYARQLLYIPSSTEDTSEAYMEAIRTRIDEYFGDTITFDIEEYRPISEIVGRIAFFDETEHKLDSAGNPVDFIDNMYFNNYYNGYNNKLDMIYKITINDEEYYFMIEKNDERMVKPKFELKDPESNVEVSSDSSEVPLDATLDVEHIDEDNDEYEEIKENVQGDFEAYDFNLFSHIKNGYIKLLVNGYLRIGISLSNKFVGKTVYVYYYNESKVLTKHKTIVIDNVAYFETNHLSTFVVAEEQTEESSEETEEKTTRNPKTGDSIYYNIIIGFLSLLVIIFNKNIIKNS